MKQIVRAACLFAGVVRPAAAQVEPRISINFGTGSAVGIGTDASDPVRINVGSIRFDLRRHLAVETEIAHMGTSADFTSEPGRLRPS